MVKRKTTETEYKVWKSHCFAKLNQFEISLWWGKLTYTERVMLVRNISDKVVTFLNDAFDLSNFPVDVWEATTEKHE